MLTRGLLTASAAGSGQSVNHIILYVIILDVFMKHGLWCWFQDLGSFWSVNQVCECPCRLYSLWTLWSMGPLVILPMVSQVGVFFWEAVLTSLQRYTEVNITVFNLQLGGSSMDMTHYLDWNKFLIQDSCSPAFMQIMLLIIVEIVCRLHRAVIIER